MKKTVVFSITLSLFLLVVMVFSVSAQGIDPSDITDDDVNEVAKQLYCPVCENIPLDVCGTQACAQWRELIREKLAQGWNQEEIKEYFVLQYGDRVLAEPPRHGLNWLVYILPPAAFLLGAFMLLRGIRSWRNPPPTEEEQKPQEVNHFDEYIDRMEQELRESDKYE